MLDRGHRFAGRYGPNLVKIPVVMDKICHRPIALIPLGQANSRSLKTEEAGLFPGVLFWRSTFGGLA